MQTNPTRSSRVESQPEHGEATSLLASRAARAGGGAQQGRRPAREQAGGDMHDTERTPLRAAAGDHPGGGPESAGGGPAADWAEPRSAGASSASSYQSMPAAAPSGSVAASQSRAHALRLARLYVLAALHDRRIDHRTDPKALWYVELYYSSRLFSLLIGAALWGYLLLTFFEDGSDYSPGLLLLCEAFFWLGVSLGFWVRYRFTDLDRLFRSRFAWIHAIALLVAGLDLVSSAVSLAFGVRYFRYLRAVRPVLQLEYSQLVRRRAVDIIRTLYRVKAALFLLLFQVTFFAVISMFLFYDTDEGRQYFSTMEQSMVNLIVLLSTCNSPRVMLPAFQENRFYSLYFVFYLIVSVYFMLNVVLAVVYNEHRRHLKREARRMTVRRRVCTTAAFRVLFLHAYPSSGADDLAASRKRYRMGVPSDLVSDLLYQLGLPPADATNIADLLETDAQAATVHQRHPPGLVSRDAFENVLLVVRMSNSWNGALVTHDDETDEDFEASFAPPSPATEAVPVGIRDPTVMAELSADYLGGEPSHRPLVRPSSGGRGASRNPRAADSFYDRFDPEIDGDKVWGGWARTKRTSARGFRRVAVRTVMHHVWLGSDIGFVKTLDLMVNLLLVSSGIATLVLICVDADLILSHDPLPYAIFNSVCSIFFGFEIALRIIAATPRRFFSYAWNIFESVVVLLSLLGVLTQFTGIEYFARNHHLFLFIRKLRLLRLLRSVPQFRLLTEILVYLVPALVTFGRVIFTFMYMYAILGIGIFGHVRLPPEAYAANDFRSFPLALLTLFELMVVNDWNATMAAFRAETGSGWTELYFIVWYVFSVIVLLNSVTSFALEALDVHITRSNLFQTVHTTKDRAEFSPVLGPPIEDDDDDLPPLAPFDLQAHSRELQRTVSMRQRFSTMQLVDRVTEAPMEINFLRLFQDVFDNEVEEPSALEIDQELSRLGLDILTSH